MKAGSNNEKRRYIRHPAQVPLICSREGHRKEQRAKLRDIGFGGLSFVCGTAFDPGDLVSVNYPSVGAEGVRGEVVWSATLGDGSRRFVCGIRFQELSTFFRVRLVEQLCRIEAYRCAQRDKKGRELSPNEAAKEWIARTAARFPQ